MTQSIPGKQCEAIGCTHGILDQWLFCRRHWLMAPKRTRRAFYKLALRLRPQRTDERLADDLKRRATLAQYLVFKVADEEIQQLKALNGVLDRQARRYREREVTLGMGADLAMLNRVTLAYQEAVGKLQEYVERYGNL